MQLQSHALIPQFISMIMAALQRMYITAWAADDLKEVVSFIRKNDRNKFLNIYFFIIPILI